MNAYCLTAGSKRWIFSGQLAGIGGIARLAAARGVHLGINKAANRLSASAIRRSPTLSIFLAPAPGFEALYIMSRNVAMNFARSAAPNLISIAPGRFVGNLTAMRDLDPQRLMEL